MKRYGLVAMFIAALALVVSAVTVDAQSLDKPGRGITVRAGEATWTSSAAKRAVIQLLLEELGYRVETTRFASNPIAYLSIDRGDVDFWPSGWFPTHWPQVPEGFAERNTLFNLCPNCSLSGYLVDIPTLEKYNITSLDDFKRDDVKAAFDIDGDGKAEIFGCPVGWGCYENVEFHLDAFDLRRHVNHVSADYTALFADVHTRIRAGQPTIYYTWAPSDYVILLKPGEDVRYIAAPSIAKRDETLPDEIFIVHGLGDMAVTDPFINPVPVGDIMIAANNAFLEANPAAARLFEVMELPLLWISEASLRINQGEDSERQIRAIAQEWIEANRDLVDDWLQQARQAAR